MASQAEIGLIGLGVMGQNLALNIADHGFEIAVYNRTAARTEAFAASEDARSRPIAPCATLEDLVGALRAPRAIILMVQAGAATDDQIAALAPLLEPGDVIVDGGNARYQDTMRRERALGERGLRLLGTGISGGEEGARHGPSIMAGGAPEAYARVQPIFEAIAARVDGAPCCAHLGPDGAGHFVKMLHNGIEYADMQLIAETYALMKDGLGLGYPEMQGTFAAWNEGDLDSYLIEITADILGKRDPETGQPMVEVILDRAGQKGTGGWAVAAALELGVAAPTIAEAVAARSLSAAEGRAGVCRAAPGRTGGARGPGRDRRSGYPARCAARRQDRGLRPGLRGHGGGQLRTRLGTRSRHHRAHLARRLHHPRAPARAHARGVRARCGARQSDAGSVLRRDARADTGWPARTRPFSRRATASRRRRSPRRSLTTTAIDPPGCRPI